MQISKIQVLSDSDLGFIITVDWIDQTRWSQRMGIGKFFSGNHRSLSNI
jgi:hypothetical protein